MKNLPHILDLMLETDSIDEKETFITLKEMIKYHDPSNPKDFLNELIEKWDQIGSYLHNNKTKISSIERNIQEKRTYTPMEVASILKLEYQTIINHIKKGNIKSVQTKNKGSYYIPVESMDVFVKQHKKHKDNWEYRYL